jgi:hypothetical protein
MHKIRFDTYNTNTHIHALCDKKTWVALTIIICFCNGTAIILLVILQLIHAFRSFMRILY